jgi:hypothetical protein
MAYPGVRVPGRALNPNNTKEQKMANPPAGIIFLTDKRDQVTKEWSKVFHAETYAELPPGTRPFIDRIIAMESRNK